MGKGNIIETRTCEECGGLMIKEMTNYTQEFMSKTFTISDIEGYRCGKCGNTHIDEDIKKYIENKLIVEELKYKTSQVKAFLLISKVKKVRLERKLVQKDAGKMLGISEQRYGVIERNSNIPLITLEHQLAYAFGVDINDLYEMVAITPEFYAKLLNMEIAEDKKSKRGYKFNYINELELLRSKLNDIKNEIKNHQIQKKTYRHLAKTDPDKKKTANKHIAEIDEVINKLKLEKNGADNKGGLEREIKQLLSKHNIIIKQEILIDYDDWIKVLDTYGDDILIKHDESMILYDEDNLDK